MASVAGDAGIHAAPYTAASPASVTVTSRAPSRPAPGRDLHAHRHAPDVERAAADVAPGGGVDDLRGSVLAAERQPAGGGAGALSTQRVAFAVAVLAGAAPDHATASVGVAPSLREREVVDFRSARRLRDAHDAELIRAQQTHAALEVFQRHQSRRYLRVP